MAISWTEITSFTDAEYDAVYDACAAELEAGGFPFAPIEGMTGSTLTSDKKKEIVKDCYNRYITDSDKFVWKVHDGDELLLLNAGFIEGTTVIWDLGLVASDSNGSKAYLHSSDFTNARNTFVSGKSCTAIAMRVVDNRSSILNHAQSKNSSNKMNATLSTTFQTTYNYPNNASQGYKDIIITIPQT